MAAKFEMNPAATRSALASVAQARSAAAGAGFPLLPQGPYIGLLSAAASAVLAAAVSQLTASVAGGSAAAAGSTSAVDATEQTNTAKLTT